MKGLNLPIVKMINHIEETLCPNQCGVVDRRRVIAYIFLSGIEAVIIPFHFFLFLLWWEPFGFAVACTHLIAYAVIQYLIWKEEVDFSQGLSALYILIGAKLTVDSVFCTLLGMPEDNISVLGNIYIMVALVVTAISMMLRTAVWVTLGMIVAVVVFFFFTQKAGVSMLSVKSILVGFVLMIYVGVYNMSRITENLRQPREVSQEERRALEMLANLKDVDAHKEGNLIERLSPEVRERILRRASQRLRKKELDNLAWDLVCAELTKSEKTICRLIVDGHSLKEICEKLNKTESNISSQRSHIRKKLGMGRTDDLQRTLEIRIAEVRRGMTS